MEPWRDVEIVLLSVTAGAPLPPILQLRATLRTVQVRRDGTSDRRDRALDQFGVAAVRVNRATDALDDGRRVRELMDAIEPRRTRISSASSTAMSCSRSSGVTSPRWIRSMTTRPFFA